MRYALCMIVALAACKSDRVKESSAATTAEQGTAAAADAPRTKEFRPTPRETLGSVPEGHGLAPGASLPDISALDLQGKSRSLRAVAGGKPMLLQFYRGGWCPYCNFQVRATAAAYPQFLERGVVPVFISVDTPDQAAKSKAAHAVEFPLLSDSKLAVHQAFRVIDTPDNAYIEKLAAKGTKLEDYSGETHHQYALPSLFLFDASGTLVWQHVDPEYKVRPSLEQVFDVLDKHGFGAPEKG